jgi:hypothetical protein
MVALLPPAIRQNEVSTKAGEAHRPLATAGGVLVPGGVFGNREDRQDHPGTAGPGTLGHGRPDAALYRTVGNTEPAGTGRVSATGDAAGRSPN